MNDERRSRKRSPGQKGFFARVGQSRERLHVADTMFRNSQEGMVITDLRGNILAVNPAFTLITEYSEADLIGANMRLLSSGRHDPAFYQKMWREILTRGGWQGEIWDRRQSGEIFPQWLNISTARDLAGRSTHYIGVVTDLSRMRHAQSHLQYLVHHDALTGLPNRSFLHVQLSRAIQHAQRNHSLVAVLFLDLDGFKVVNDSLGHDAGDQVLRMAAMRLRQRMREFDTVARLGGDEFVIVAEQLSAEHGAAQIAQAVIDLLAQPFELPDGRKALMGASVGISLFPRDGTHVNELLRNADAALYRAKALGRGTWRFAGPT